MINKFIKKFTTEKIGEIVKIGRNYYLVNSELLKIKDKIKHDVFSLGVYLGEERSKQFMPSIELINILSKLSDKKIVVNDKAEWLFLCERDVFKKSVLKGDLKFGDMVLVQNSKDENLGLGLFDGKVVKNLVDKGNYLRMEK